MKQACRQRSSTYSEERKEYVEDPPPGGHITIVGRLMQSVHEYRGRERRTACGNVTWSRPASIRLAQQRAHAIERDGEADQDQCTVCDKREGGVAAVVTGGVL